MPTDFRRLWIAYATSEAGTWIGHGALPLIAVLLLDSPAYQISLLAALGALAGAALAIPAGPWVEFRRKRPVMIAADLARFAALASVPAAVALDALTYAQLCAVAVIGTAGAIVFAAASGAHLRDVVPAEKLVAANARFETTMWTAVTAGPPVGGLLVGWIGATASIAVDAVSYLLSALGVTRLRTPEPAPPRRRARDRGVAEGWRRIGADPLLHRLLWNSLLFGGGIMMTSPLLAVFLLRDLGLGPFEFGLAIGVPGLGGILGSLLARRLSGRFGERRTLLALGVLRTLWTLVLPLAPKGTAGLVVVIAAETGLLISAGVFNPVFAAVRLKAIAREHTARVLGAWSVSTKLAQPLFMAAGGVLATLLGTRAALAVAGAIVLATVALLPWRQRSPDATSRTTASAYASSSGPSPSDQR
ncbi:MFS transporter [Actinorhabdospora filicis]|uniref:MFS transporter n=1 Tax=Actinorhabdospora filicis TaxID=1785913 RepID=A0A9W6SJM4_9ACTN|nr:MFS transporter [Actinorhabdospora filicis]GLZ77463.1 MFS transporter [Actinorhabdospora filicis]